MIGPPRICKLQPSSRRPVTNSSRGCPLVCGHVLHLKMMAVFTFYTACWGEARHLRRFFVGFAGIAPELVHFRDGSDFVPGASYYILRPGLPSLMVSCIVVCLTLHGSPSLSHCRHSQKRLRASSTCGAPPTTKSIEIGAGKCFRYCCS